MTDREMLTGRRILVTRAGAAGERFAARLRHCGAEPIVNPLIAIEPPNDWQPLDDALTNLNQFDWLICTSANAVKAVFDRLDRLSGKQQRPATLLIGAVGNTTAAAFGQHGWRVDRLPSTQTADGLLNAIGDVESKQILFPASDIARPHLSDGLRLRGAIITQVTAYHTVTIAPKPYDPLVAALRAGTIDAITLTSPSTVRGLLQFMKLAGVRFATLACVCVGPVTAAAAREAGLSVSAVAEDQSEDGLIVALESLFTQTIEIRHQNGYLVEGAR